MTTTKPIRKFTVEFMIIVVGVFIAVAAESWWSERENRALERDVRADIVQEFASNIQILEQDIAANEQVLPLFNALPEMTDDALLEISDQELNERSRPMIDWAGFDAEMGIAQALVNSGNLGNISDNTLRLRLSRWAGLMVEKDRKTLQATQFQFNALMPVIAMVAADGIWTPSERRQVQSLQATMLVLHQMTVENQHLLLEEALLIHAYLSDTND